MIHPDLIEDELQGVIDPKKNYQREVSIYHQMQDIVINPSQEKRKKTKNFDINSY